MNTAPIRPMLGDLELPLVQLLRTEEDQVWVEHGVPALEGSLLQRLGRAPTRVLIHGVMAGDKSLQDLDALRKLYQDAKPLTFAADIMTATKVSQMVIADLTVRERAGKPQCFNYFVNLVEFILTPDPKPPPPPPPPGKTECDGKTGDIEVTVVLPQGQTDFTDVVVRIQRTDVEGAAPIEITEQTGGKFTKTKVDKGEYRATAFRRT